MATGMSGATLAAAAGLGDAGGAGGLGEDGDVIDTDSTSGLVEAEIVRHHQVIERWLTGAMPHADFAMFADAHAPGFTLVEPGGRTLSREQILAEVSSMHGKVPGLTIGIGEVRVVASGSPLLAATYQEHQPGRSRQSTVLFHRDGARLLWLHLHETWLP